MRFRFSPIRRLVAATTLLGLCSAGRAMSVVAPSFDQLVSTANLVVRGVVTDVHCVTVDTPQGQAIRTVVTMHVERTLKGTADADVTFSYLGGKVGHHIMSIPGMPAFNVGDREIVFITDKDRMICPLVAAGHGRYHVRHDPVHKRDYVSRDNGAPLASTDQVAQPLDEAAPATTTNSAQALDPDTFETKVLASARKSGHAAQP